MEASTKNWPSGWPRQSPTSHVLGMARTALKRVVAPVYDCAYDSAVTFEWDPAKAASNRRKHRVDFADAVAVFEDPAALTMDEEHFDEARFVTIGLDSLARVIVVCWTDRSPSIRLISARKATPAERAQYLDEG